MKQDDPEEKYRYTYIAAAVFIAIVMVVLLNYQATYDLACGRWAANKDTADQSCIRNYIFDFQSLITGLLAVTAAFLTINQMRNSDRKADIKHEELVRLQTHRDSLIIERAITHWLNVFESCLARLEKIGVPKTPKQGEKPDTRRYLQNWVAELKWVKARIEDTKNDPHWTTACPLFPGQLSFSYGSLCNLFNQEDIMEKTSIYISRHIFYDATPIYPQEAEEYKTNFQICEVLRNNAISEIEAIIIGMRKLAKIYSVAGGE